MISGLIAVFGAITGMVPAIMQWLTLRETNAQAIKLEELRQKGEIQKIAGEVDIANTQADVRQADHIYEFAGGASGYRLVDALAVFVRPYVTLVFFHLWVFLEICLAVYGINSGYDLGQLVKLIWSDETAAIFGAIMGFWFGDRMMLRGQQRMAATLAVTQKPAAKP